MMLSKNSPAERAQMESDEVAAVSVLRTGDSAINARKTMTDDLARFEPTPASAGEHHT